MQNILTLVLENVKVSVYKPRVVLVVINETRIFGRLRRPYVRPSGMGSTVGINPRLSDLKGPGTSKLDWRYLEHNKIDRNKLQIRTNSQKGTGTKMAEKLNNFEKFERKKVKFQPCS